MIIEHGSMEHILSHTIAPPQWFSAKRAHARAAAALNRFFFEVWVIRRTYRDVIVENGPVDEIVLHTIGASNGLADNDAVSDHILSHTVRSPNGLADNDAVSEMCNGA